jgi:hypothetical protein
VELIDLMRLESSREIGLGDLVFSEIRLGDLVSERVSGVVVLGLCQQGQERIRGAVGDNLVFLRKIKS